MGYRSEYLTFLGVFSVFVFVVKQVLSSKSASSGGSTTATPDNPEFKTFQRKYLVIFGLVWMADWLQGPYVYALYASYNYTIDQIGILFIAGFATAGVCGIFVGALADRLGRRNACLAYAVIYAGACVTKHFNDYNILMLGRFFGGTATALLYTAFESWMVSEHKSKQFGDAELGETFTKSGQLNGIVAVIAGVMASYAADAFGPVAPFDLSMCCLFASFCVVCTLPENYGQSNRKIGAMIKDGLGLLCSSPSIMLLGLSQSFFEGGMFTFVFMWTPAIEEVAGADGIPHGLIFACFMVSCILGSTIFGFFSSRGTRTELIAFFNYIAAIGFLWLSSRADFLTRNIAFLGFEACVGVFWPCAMSLRSKYIPEEVRATIMNFFRIPLNVIVVIVLMRVKQLPTASILNFCAFCMFTAAIMQYYLVSQSKSTKSTDANYVKVPAQNRTEQPQLGGLTESISDWTDDDQL